MATDFDPYRILEVERSAGQDQIDAAYRRLWTIYPQDSSPGERLREIQAAYRVLSDPDERRAYDERTDGRQANGGVSVAPAEQPAPTGEVDGRVPWGLREILQAIAAVIGITAVGLIILSIAAYAVAGDTDKLDTDPNAVAIQLLVTVVFEGALVAGVYWFAIKKFRISWATFGIKKPAYGSFWFPLVLLMAAMALQIVYGLALSLIGIHPDLDLPDPIYHDPLPIALFVVSTLAIAPIAEEIFFRGLLFRGFASRWGTAWGMIGSGGVFGLAHILNPGYYYVVPEIVLIGMLFAWGYNRSQSLLTTMATHMLFNAIAIASTFANR